MICTEARERMSAMLDGALSPEEAAALQAHLDGCPACAKEFDALLALETNVAALREPAPEGLKKGVLYRIDQATGKAKTPKRRWFGPGTAMGAVAAVLVLLVGVGVIPLGRQTAAKPAEMAMPADTAAVQTDGAHLDENYQYQMPALSGLESDTISPEREPTKAGSASNGKPDWMTPQETAPAEAAESTEERNDGYYLSGGDSENRLEARPLDEATRALCAARSREDGRMLLLYTEFDSESLLDLLEREEPKLYELLADAPITEEDGLRLLETDCGTALAVHEWLLENLPRSEVMDDKIRAAEMELMIRMDDLDPENGSLYRVVTWAPRAKPVEWPQTWPDSWAVRLRTEENWALFFPSETFAPSGDKPASIVFLSPES